MDDVVWGRGEVTCYRGNRHVTADVNTDLQKAFSYISFVCLDQLGSVIDILLWVGFFRVEDEQWTTLKNL